MSLPEPLTLVISQLKKLPGLGEKSARRMAFALLQDGQETLSSFIAALTSLRDDVTICQRCGNLTVEQPCAICSDPLRDHTKLCVVESLEDLTAIESSGIHQGLYFNLALSGSLLDNSEIIPEETLNRLQSLIDEEPLQEIIVATNPRMEGDLTFYALCEALEGQDLVISRPAYGLPVGGAIEFVDPVTLSAAFKQRQRSN